tara:strand:- start:352 stop:1203 length:852 start_codon:yes stop_codon:yes gene_type:complete
MKKYFNRLIKFIKDKYWILPLIISLIVISYIINNIEYSFMDIVEVENPYLLDKSLKLKWIHKDKSFMINNFPNTFDFDYEIKKDLLEHSLKLPQDYGIIDCGGHIGDGAIPIAHALKFNNRKDITVYAIDPSKYKCDFINYIKELNNLDNLIVLNYGLTDKDNVEYTYDEEWAKKWLNDNNTGGINWQIKDMKSNSVGDDNIFMKLDTLISKNIIKHKLGAIHLDVENMEDKAILGGKSVIMEDKPYISLEDHNNDINKYMELLDNKYKYVKRLDANNIFIPK